MREGGIIAPENEPERARKTSAGNYLDGVFDGDDLKRIVNDEDVRTLDGRGQRVRVRRGDGRTTRTKSRRS